MGETGSLLLRMLDAGSRTQGEVTGRREAAVPTHVPGADEDGDHVGLRLLRVLVLHLLQELAEAFSLLGIEGQTDSERPLHPPITLSKCVASFRKTERHTNQSTLPGGQWGNGSQD